MADDRVVRKCSECNQEDDHPHHITYAAIGFVDPITQKPVVEDRSVSRHLDCCNCDHCTIQLSHAGDKRGPELTEFVTNPPEELKQHLRDAGYEVA